MNKNVALLGAVLCGAVVLSMSCGKKEETPSLSQTAQEAQKEIQKAATETQKAAEQTATQAAAEATKQADSAASQVKDQAKQAMESAKALMADKKYAEALAALQKQSGQQLSPEMKSMFDELIKQIQQAMASSVASDPAKALGGLLGGKK